jgi:hypothetical protein
VLIGGFLLQKLRIKQQSRVETQTILHSILAIERCYQKLCVQLSPEFQSPAACCTFEQAPYLGGSVSEETAAVSNLFKNKAAAGNDMGRSGRHVCTLVKHKKGAEQKLLGVQRRRTHTNQAAAPRHATDSSPAGDQRSGVCRRSISIVQITAFTSGRGDLPRKQLKNKFSGKTAVHTHTHARSQIKCDRD